MKDKKKILFAIRQRSALKQARKRKSSITRSSRRGEIAIIRNSLPANVSIRECIERFMPPNLKYVLSENDGQLTYSKVRNCKLSSNNGQIVIPKNFSIVDNSTSSYETLTLLLKALLIEKNRMVTLDYAECKRIDLPTQVFTDIILKDMIAFYKICHKIYPHFISVVEIGGQNINNDSVRKLLFSVGSPAILTDKTISYDDIIPYKLCIHDNETGGTPAQRIEQKDIDTTELADYVINCLSRMNKQLTSERLDDLCTVIGEILINAEEHSTTKFRFSIGYFQDHNEDNEHTGIFRLTILNFGKTIYEKFKDPECPNKDIVNRMTSLSSSYTKKNWFKPAKFEEETLWTLYALQEGVTSVSQEKYLKRGNGSIRFIESFFNIKGNDNMDNISKMYIVSGKTQIIFDGKYGTHEISNADGRYKVMTFNDEGNIESMPDQKYVYCTDSYFPGTIINAKIWLNDNDITTHNN